MVELTRRLCGTTRTWGVGWSLVSTAVKWSREWWCGTRVRIKVTSRVRDSRQGIVINWVSIKPLLHSLNLPWVPGGFYRRYHKQKGSTSVIHYASDLRFVRSLPCKWSTSLFKRGSMSGVEIGASQRSFWQRFRLPLSCPIPFFGRGGEKTFCVALFP